MSDDLERRLKEIPSEFPRPDEAITRRVVERARALARKGPRKRRMFRQIIALAAALLRGAALGWAASGALATQAGPVAAGDPTISARFYTIGEARFVNLQGRVPQDAAGFGALAVEVRFSEPVGEQLLGQPLLRFGRAVPLEVALDRPRRRLQVEAGIRQQSASSPARLSRDGIVAIRSASTT